jgi:hypothetical protein
MVEDKAIIPHIQKSVDDFGRLITAEGRLFEPYGHYYG